LDSDDRELKIENSRRHSKRKEKKKKAKHFGFVIVVLLVIASAAGVYFGISASEGETVQDFISDLKSYVSDSAVAEEENISETEESKKNI